MSMLFRDPLMRELLLGDLGDRRQYRPSRLVPAQHLHYQPIRVRRYEEPVHYSFDQALDELQNVMDNVNDAIGHYHSNLTKDVAIGGMKTVRTEDGNLQVAMDVSQFKPEEISVRLSDDNLVVEAKTESSENDSYHKAEFKRWFKLPQDVKPEAIKSTLTLDKKLLVEVPCAKPIDSLRSRNIPIQVQQPQQQPVEDDKQNQKNQTNAKEQEQQPQQQQNK